MNIFLVVIRNMGVSYDGSWPQRGHQSLHGFGSVIDLLTGYVLDFEIASKYCQICKNAAKELGKDSPEFYFWYQGHAADCCINHEGSSGKMEITVAEILWRRSKEKGFEYKVVLSDGDSKTKDHLDSLEVYGPNCKITKEECINHVSKRYYHCLNTFYSQTYTLHSHSNFI